ncbi:MAG TPA: enolase C-terminal domain-like protein [Streptosporangiaceae bacterium]
MPVITSSRVLDLRFPTSATMDGSDAMNPDGDYSAAYVILGTNTPGLCGYGLTFTIGRGNDICVLIAERFAAKLVGSDVASLSNGGMARFYRELVNDSQWRWLGPEKGAVQMSIAAVLNATWDLMARYAGMPVWQLLSTMSPRALVGACDFRYLSDAITPDEAVAMLEALAPTRADRIAKLKRTGYPAYSTSPGWLGYPDEKMRRLVREAAAGGFRDVKLKVGARLEDDIRRLGIAREELGPDRGLMIDCNQVWEVDQAISWVRELARFHPRWIEEPTSPDDIAGHRKIREALAGTGVGVATGEHAHNRIMFKQLLQGGAIDYCQVDSCRVASINEIVPILLMAAKFGVPVCPHAGGFGLCEYVQHLSIFDYVCVSASLENRMIEYVDHLHEHFVDPVVISDGAYQVPAKPGYSIEVLPTTMSQYRYPDGEFWAGNKQTSASSAGLAR